MIYTMFSFELLRLHISYNEVCLCYLYPYGKAVGVYHIVPLCLVDCMYIIHEQSL